MTCKEGAVRDENETESQGGSHAVREPVSAVRAARLNEIKSHIVDSLRQHGLSIHAVAGRHGISVSYVRQLFAAEGTTFTEFVLQQRLAAADAMLRDPHFADRSITAIAFEAGFGDVAYFNRIFRRRLGKKPSDARIMLRKD
jgi:AraC-like DNA-binding protein